MGKKRCLGVGDKDLPEADLIQKILVRLPVVSLLRFKSVSKSWCALIQTSSFIDLQFNSSSSSSNTFGSFILQAAIDCERFRGNALLMLSSSVPVPESESRSITTTTTTLCSAGSFGGFNSSICAPCVTHYKIGACWWKTNANDDQVYEDDDDEQQQLVLKLDNLGFPSWWLVHVTPSCYNFGVKIRPIMVVGSCNGLICLHDSERSDVSLWNPATRQFRILPKSITFHGDDCLHHRLFAFGFDAKTKDYKVVLLSGLRLRPRRIIDDGGLSVVVVGPMECLCRVQVYSLSTDSWRLLEGINLLPGLPFPYPPPVPDDSSPPPPPPPPGQGQLLYLNGSCFFIAKFQYSSSEEHCIPPPPKDNDRFIISLDLTKEIITPIRLPYHRGSEELYLLCYVDDKLALFTNRSVATGCWQLFHILVLNEHCSSGSGSGRNYESWTELHYFRIKHGLPGEWIIPRGISNDGVFVFLETIIHGLDKKKKKMKLYNLVTQEVKKIFIYSDQVLPEAYAYKPSLVSIEMAAATAAMA